MKTESWLKVGGSLVLLGTLWIASGRSPAPGPGSSHSSVSASTAVGRREVVDTVNGVAPKAGLTLGQALDAEANARPRPVFRKLDRRRPPELEADPQFHKLLEIDSARKMALLQKEPEELKRVRQQVLSEDAIPQRVLEAALLDSNPEVRMAALYEISLALEEPPLDLLAAVVEGDPSAEVRLEALTIIADSDDEKADDLIRSSLDDPDEAVRSEAQDLMEVRSDELL